MTSVRRIIPLAALVFVLAGCGSTTITLLQTADVHGHVADYDFFRGRNDALGLATVASVVREERRRDGRATRGAGDHRYHPYRCRPAHHT